MKDALRKSLLLHLVVFILFVIDLPLFWFERTPPGQVPIIVDLKDVKISEMTNLPPKAKFGKEDKAASQVKRKIEKNYAKEEPKPEVRQENPKKEEPEVKDTPKIEPQPSKPKRDFLEAPEPQKPAKKAKPKKIAPPPSKPKFKASPAPKKPEPEKEDKQPTLANPLKSLLASVDALEKAEGNTDSTATIKEGTDVQNMGIEGGIGGSYFSELSISEIDAIAGRLRACWNLDPGAMVIEDMIVEIRAQLNQDGTVRSVDILNDSRYNSDSHFRSVADSAKRAVYICAPYTILADKYADKYDLWKTMLLRFNPLDASIQ